MFRDNPFEPWAGNRRKYSYQFQDMEVINSRYIG